MTVPTFTSSGSAACRRDRSRRRIAAGCRGRRCRVHHGLDAGLVKVAGDGGAMVLMRMDAAGGDQADQVAGPAGLLQRIHQGGECGHLGDAAVGHRSPIRTSSCFTTRPAPMFRWPTSELPICPSAGRHRGRSVQEGVRAGLPQAVKVGVLARRTALSAFSSRQPKPSRITSITGLVGMRRYSLCQPKP